MTSHRSFVARLGLAVGATTLTLGACGSDGTPDIELSPAGEAGRQLALDKGCASCHGTSGEGRVGPAFAGLYGRTVELQDGTTVVADDAYITESIKDPSAKRVKGYNLPMPQTNLSDDEIASIIDYIRELSQPATTGTTAP